MNKSRRLKMLVWWQLGLLCFTPVWLLLDPVATEMIRSIESSPLDDDRWVSFCAIGGSARVAVFSLLFVSLAWYTATVLFLVLLGRRRGDLRGILMSAAIIALWCGIISQHSSIAWQGKRIRVSQHVDHLAPIVTALQSQWPNSDGELSGIGPFLAYPPRDPAVLILLAPPDAALHTSFCAVERSAVGSLKFQLSGDDRGDWVEWHPEGQHPSSFVGGLRDRYKLIQSAHLHGHWFLVRYAPEDNRSQQYSMSALPDSIGTIHLR